MSLIPLLVLTACLSVISTWAGTIATVDGQKLEGTVRFAGDSHVSIQTAAGPHQVVPLTNVLTARFDPPGAGSAPNISTNWLKAEIGKSYSPTSRGQGCQVLSEHAIAITDGGHWIGRPDGDHGKASFDGCHFVYKSLRGSGQITARVRCVTGAVRGRFGLMFRESLRSDAPFALVTRGERYYTQMLGRESESKLVQSTPFSERGIIGATWLKLVREGYAFSGYESPDGSNWVRLGELPVVLPEAEPILVGVAAAAIPGDEGNTNYFEHISITSINRVADGNGWLPKGVLTRNGSSLGVEISSANAGKVVFSHAGLHRELPLTELACLTFKQLSPTQHELLQEAKPGALLYNGDFVEGEFQSFDGDEVTLNSVLFGIRTFNRNTQVAAVRLRLGEASSSAAWTVVLHDFSRLRADRLSVRQNRLIIADKLLGNLEISLSDIAEIYRPSR